jgi:hypothetical protein
MAVFRGPIVTRIWQKDPAGAAMRAHDGVWTNRLLNLLAAEDVFFDGAGKAPNYDWPNPVGLTGDRRGWKLDRWGAAMRSEGEVWRNRLFDLLKSKDVFFGSPGMGPDYDWPNPVIGRGRGWKADVSGAAVRSQGEVFGTRLLNTLKSQDTFFGGAGQPPANLDWPNPQPPKPRSIDLRTFLNPTEIQLIGQDTFFGSPGMGPDYDWPNPTLKRPNLELRTWLDPYKINLQSQDTFFGLAGHPTFDWPNPTLKRPDPSTRTWLDPYKINLQSKDVFFDGAGRGPNYDWPNPTLSKNPRRDLLTYTAASRAILAGQDAFFGLAGNPNFDQPNPLRYIPGITLKTWVEGLKQNLIGQDFFFGLAGNPTFDWPVPKGYRYPIDVRTHLDPLKLNLRGKDQFFGAPGQGPVYDYPNPPGYRPFFEHGQVIAGALLAELYPAVLPFSMLDWPNPFMGLRAGSRAWLYTLTGTTALTPVGPSGGNSAISFFSAITEWDEDEPILNQELVGAKEFIAITELKEA